MPMSESLARLAGLAEPDGTPLAVMDWPELGSPVPRLTLSIDDGQMLIRINEAMRRLVLATAKEPRRQVAA
jgi:hypothetical protein